MTDSEYMDLAEALLKTVEANCDRINAATDADIDNQRSGGMVTLTFCSGTQVVVNQQKPLHEIWLASKAGGFHFQYVNGAWQDTKSQGEFFEILSDSASMQAGQTLRFIP